MPFALTSRTSMPRSVASTRRNCGVVTKISSWRSDSQIPPLSTSCGVTALIVSLLSSPPALAAGLQSADISGFIPAAPQEWIKANDDKRAQLQSDEERFSQSPTLKVCCTLLAHDIKLHTTISYHILTRALPLSQALLEKSEANKAQNMKDIRDKYCYRQVCDTPCRF